jgi:CBS domain-containing protein
LKLYHRLVQNFERAKLFVSCVLCRIEIQLAIRKGIIAFGKNSDMRPLKIAEALPGIFNRVYPILEPGTQLLLAASLLRFHQIDAIPIGFQKKQKKRLAVVGYSCLSALLKSDPAWYKAFLEQPCESAAQEIATVSADSEVSELLDTFADTEFGFAWVEGEFEIGGLASLRDVLSLYETGTITTTLSVDEVASPIFAISSDATIRDALTQMFERRFRRVFLDSGENRVVTDRKIISYIFSAARLDAVAKFSADPLNASLRDVEAMRPKRIRGNPNLKEAADAMKTAAEECLVAEKGVVTPWDAIMKPWTMGRLCAN